MKRITCRPRPGWEKTIESQGLLFSRTAHPDGQVSHYWNESAAYVFTLDEVTLLEGVTEELHAMCLEAAHFLASGALGTLGLSPEAFELAQHSLATCEPDFYARFDLCYSDPETPAKLYEYNADTPTGLVESSIVQWYWKQDTHPHLDQWNGIHEALVDRWSRLREVTGGHLLHVAHSELEPTGEDWSTAAYVRDTASQAGWDTVGITMSEIGWNDTYDFWAGLDGERIFDLYKLYPWEDLISEPFGRHVLDHPHAVRWYEPAWKMFLSNKLLLPALWTCFPNHPNLLPAYVDGPHGLREWVRKPIFGREGDGIEIVADGVRARSQHEYPGAIDVYQQFWPLPTFSDETGRRHHPVIGSWVVSGESWGVGIRESDGLLTDYYCRFVPNLIDG